MRAQTKAERRLEDLGRQACEQDVDRQSLIKTGFLQDDYLTLNPLITLEAEPGIESRSTALQAVDVSLFLFSIE